MSLTLFYNAFKRNAAIGQFTENNIVTTKVFPDGAFGSWTHIVQFKSKLLENKTTLFFYNKENRGGAVGFLTETGFTTTVTFPENSFGDWTHIVASDSLLFFYDRYSGAAAIGTTEPEKINLSSVNSGVIDHTNHLELAAPVHAATPLQSKVQAAILAHEFRTMTSYAQGSFGTWTTLLIAGLLFLFYNKNNGAGSIGNLNEKELTTIKDYGTGHLGKWTHVVGAGSYVLFYDEVSRNGRISKLSDGSLKVVKEFGKGSFGAWTHISTGMEYYKMKAAPTGLIGEKGAILEADGTAVLFYNTHTGAGALGKLSNDNFITVKTFGDRSFGSWTGISSASAYIDPYVTDHTIVRTATGVRIMSHDGNHTEISTSNEKLTPAQQKELQDTIIQKMEQFLKNNIDDIKSRKIKAADIGGVLYGATAAAILMIFAPVAGSKLLDKIIAIPFVSASSQIGRYYGSAVDELIAVLKGTSKPTLMDVVGTLATIHIVATQLQFVALFGTDAWSLTKEVGAMLGDTVTHGLNGIVDVVTDVFDAGKKAADDVLDFIKNIVGF